MRTKEDRIKSFKKAEASLALEGLNPAGDPIYELVKSQVIEGQLTTAQAKAELVRMIKQERAEAGNE